MKFCVVRHTAVSVLSRTPPSDFNPSLVPQICANLKENHSVQVETIIHFFVSKEVMKTELPLLNLRLLTYYRFNTDRRLQIILIS